MCALAAPLFFFLLLACLDIHFSKIAYQNLGNSRSRLCLALRYSECADPSGFDALLHGDCSLERS
jgi:hypothetical protein